MPIVQPNTSSLASYSSQRGFNIVEVLVATLVASIGMLGIASLQINSVNTASVSYTHTQAMSSLQQMVDLLRADSSAAKAGNYNLPSGNGTTLVSFADMTATPSSTDSIATQKTYYWLKNLEASLPNSSAGIACDTEGMCALRIRFQNADRKKSVSSMNGATLIQTVSVQL
ncbi:MAG: Unknown protein [uncultured Thiotrichaceae bacterium]|uniref:Type IV pilus modification protein PilV n=1 Tax=uncultured Thiotrichaceae bacterium TaxID=298394 RepID=A0A6S6SBE5_9GAMM|nr:MAG: Unknown protein [uncultured Thiotrichaceae bacterium]